MNLGTVRVLSIKSQVLTERGVGTLVAVSLYHLVDSPLIVILCIMPKIDCGIELGYHLLVSIMLEAHDVLDVPVLTHPSHIIINLILQISHMSPIRPQSL